MSEPPSGGSRRWWVSRRSTPANSVRYFPLNFVG